MIGGIQYFPDYKYQKLITQLCKRVLLVPLLNIPENQRKVHVHAHWKILALKTI